MLSLYRMDPSVLYTTLQIQIIHFWESLSYLVPWILIFAQRLLHYPEFIFSHWVVLWWWHKQKWQTYTMKHTEEQFNLRAISRLLAWLRYKGLFWAAFKAFNIHFNTRIQVFFFPPSVIKLVEVKVESTWLAVSLTEHITALYTFIYLFDHFITIKT